jgi:hypothetical protein
MADNGQPDWTQLPADLLELIANKTLDAVAGVTPFRSVCRAWRAAVGDAPRLLLPPPSPSNGGGNKQHTLVFPVARGWSVIVDLRDTSCRLSHLATGATFALPDINAVRAAGACRVVRHGYYYFGDDQGEQDAPAAMTVGGRAARYPRNFRVSARFRLAAADGYRWRYSWTRHQVRMDPRWMDAVWRRGRRNLCIFQFNCCGFSNYLGFSDCFRFSVHVPPAPASSGGMLVTMYHMLQGKTGLVFCRPGDAAWTKLDNPGVDDDGPSEAPHFHDFAYLDGEIFALDRDGVTVVFDSATLEAVDIVDVPPETLNITTKMYGRRRADHTDDDAAVAVEGDSEDYLHLVALPRKLLLVRTRVRSSEPESFDVFELGTDDNDRTAWCKVAGGHGGYDLFLDRYHATFSSNAGGGRGDLIYYVHDCRHGDPDAAAYCYSIQDDKLECVYRPPEQVDEFECSMKPSWFVP